MTTQRRARSSRRSTDIVRAQMLLALRNPFAPSGGFVGGCLHLAVVVRRGLHLPWVAHSGMRIATAGLPRVSRSLCQVINEAAGNGVGREGKGLTVRSSSSCAGWRGVSARIGQDIGPTAALVRMSSFTCHHADRPEPGGAASAARQQGRGKCASSSLTLARGGFIADGA